MSLKFLKTCEFKISKTYGFKILKTCEFKISKTYGFKILKKIIHILYCAFNPYIFT